MIVIFEDIAQKVPGSTSLYLSSPYNQDIINIIKQKEGYFYHKKLNLWEISLLNLSYLLDNLTSIDDIELNLLEEKEKQNAKISLTYKLDPFSYQREGIEYGLNHDKWLLLDAPGLGKSAQIIHIAEELYAKGQIEHCLIICGINTLKNNWKKEIEKHSNLSCVILGQKINSKGKAIYESVEKRVQQLYEKIDEFFIITNIETFRNNDILAALDHGKNDINMVIVDEVHVCKNPSSQQGKNLLKLKKPNYKIAATGTLLLNNPIDAYVPLKWIDAEHSSFSVFKNYYCRYGGYFNNIVIGFKNLDLLKDQIANNSLRRTKDILDLPPKTLINEYVDMNEQQSKFYQDLKQGILEEVDKVNISTTSLLSLVTRLRQATADPKILTSSEISSSKLERAQTLAEEIISNNDKVVIFSTFKDSCYELAKLLADYQPLICTGDVEDLVIAENINKFQTDENCKILIGTWQKMGTGITLTAANYMIFIDTPWTWAVYEQACDRIYRIGTNKKVFIYNLICKDTIDERVLDILNTKQVIGDYIIDDKLNNANLEMLKKYIIGEN